MDEKEKALWQGDGDIRISHDVWEHKCADPAGFSVVYGHESVRLPIEVTECPACTMTLAKAKAIFWSTRRRS
jgi:hypothetical protein